MKKVLLIHGPNLGMLGRRKPHLYGTETQSDLLLRVKNECGPEFDVELIQSNHEGVLIDALNQVVEFANSGSCNVFGILINPAALTHTSVALRDALEMVIDAGVPVIEVHLSDISAREEFRKKSLITEIVNSSISGLGPSGYTTATRALTELIQTNLKSRKT